MKKFLNQKKEFYYQKKNYNEKEDKNKGLINKIITNKEEANEFANFFFNNEISKFELLYQATRDGDKISDIINKIKGYSPTVFLLYTQKRIKCGGYTKA